MFVRSLYVPHAGARAELCPRKAAPLLLLGCAIAAGALAQTVGPNVNMVSGTQWPGGDPFLQRQNEPSMAISSRNPLHIVAGSNDYRTVDLPGVGGEGEPTGDAWLGFYTSSDGGQTWTSTLIPGYPQDTSLAGILSPLKGLQAGADPTVRPGTNGMFFYSGLAFNRATNGASEIFVAAYIDDNNAEGGNSVRYLWTSPVYATNPARQQQSPNPVTYFEDKPALAVDMPRQGGGACVIPGPSLKTIISGGELFPAGNIYVTWTQFTGGEDSTNAQILFARSIDCGLTWSAPQTVSGSALTNQGAGIAVDPNTGTVYVVWRVFAAGTTPDEIMYAASTNGGRTFSKPAVISTINPFDQGTTDYSFRTNAYPSAAVDNNGRLYVAWSQRGTNGGDARIQLVTGTPSGSGTSLTVRWTAPVMVDSNPSRGHQIMPTLAFSSGKLTVAWYDLRNDDLLNIYTPAGGGQYSIALQNDGGAPDFPSFGTYIQDPAPPYTPEARRQTLDVRAAQALPASVPVFFPSVQVSSYAFGSVPGSAAIQQLQLNPPNLPMFQTGSVPFFGDYVDIAGPTFIANQNGTWRYNNQSSDPDFTHVVWTDNRDVVAPADGNWANYVPPTYGTSTTSLYDPTQPRPQCSTSNSGQTGDRNQNIYSAELSPGLTLSAPGNSKPLGYVSGSNTQLIQRAFPIIAANTTAQTRSYQLTIASQPTGGAASFLQTSALTQITVQIAALSSTSRTVFATSTNTHALITVNAVEVTSGVSNPETASVTLNGDSSNPSPSTSSLASSENYTPTISNPNIGNPNIGNPNIGNPNIGNPNIGNPNIGNPNIANPNIGNPNIGNADVANPNIGNPNIGNADLSNATISDGTWTVTNTGNTSSAYTVNLFGQTPPSGVTLQLILYENYNTPLAQGCTLSLQSHFVPVANITNVTFATLASLLQPAATNPLAPAITLAPGQSALITVRAYDFNTNNPVIALQQYNPITQASPIVVAQGSNTGMTQPPITLTVLTKSLPPATLTGTYGSQTLQATGGSGAYTWSIVGTAPAGITLQNNVLSWNSAQSAPGTFSFTVQVKDAAGNTAQQLLTLVVNPSPLIAPATLPPAGQGIPYTQVLSVTGGTAPFGPWSVVPGSPLPTWLTLNNATGSLSGTPPSAATFSFAVQITDANGVTASQAYNLVVNPSGVGINTTSLPAGRYNSPYAPFTPSTTGGTAPFTWSLAQGGVLPVGMTLDPSSGTISGTPAQAGMWNVPLTVTDSANPPTTQTATLPLTIGLATAYAGGNNCYMPYPATPLYYPGAVSWTLGSSTLPIAGQMTLLQGNVLTGCLNANGTTFISGSYTLQFTVGTNSGSSNLTMTLPVVAQDQQSNGTYYADSAGVRNLPPSGYQQGVVTPSQALTFSPGYWGASAQNFSGSYLFGFSGSAPQFCTGSTSTSGPISLTVPQQPGRYDIAFDGSTQTCQQSPGFPTSPLPIVIDSVDAIGASASIGGATVSNVTVTSSNPGAVQAAGNVLEIESGSSSLNTVTVQFQYSIVDTACPGCVDQIEVGLNTDAGPQTCAYNGVDGPGGVSGTANITINVPNTPGRYYIGMDRGQDFACNDTTTKWWNGPPPASRYIAIVDVWSAAVPY